LVNGMINENTVLSSSLNLGKFYTGNKAAVSIRARIGDQTVCFISAHLAAHRGSGPAITRTEHITYTLQHLAFYGCVEYGNINGRNGQQYNCCSDANNDNHQQALLSSNKVQGGGKEIASLEVVDHDLCILLGDLNSRMREDVDQSTVRDVIQSYGSGYARGHQTNHGEIANKMLSWDEFKSEPMASTLSNLRFQEGPITFSPTYKLTPKTSKYHVPPVQNPKKVFNHCPAWCDRILYAVRRSSNQKSITVNQNKYYSAPVYISDHLPVWSIFTLNTNDSEGGGISGGSSTNTGNIDTERIEEARLKSLNFSKVDSRDYGCGAGDCNIM
jgi:phosphatidylinositol-bisphosphatase